MSAFLLIVKSKKQTIIKLEKVSFSLLSTPPLFTSFSNFKWLLRIASSQTIENLQIIGSFSIRTDSMQLKAKILNFYSE